MREQGGGRGGGSTEEARLQDVKGEGQCKGERQDVAEVVVQAWRSLAGIQRGGNTEAAEAFHSPFEAEQSLEEEERETDEVRLFP